MTAGRVRTAAQPPVAGSVGIATGLLAGSRGGGGRAALSGAFVGGIPSALEERGTRVPAAIAFLVVASGIAAAGVGSACCGLAAGGLALVVLRRPVGPSPPPDRS